MFAILSKRTNLLPKLSKTSYLLLFFSFMECAAGGIIYYLSLYLGTATSLTKLQFGQIGSVVGFGSLCGAFLATYITDKICGKKIIVISFCCLSFGFYCLPQSMSFLIISLCALLIAIATNTFLTANNTLLLQTSSQEPETLRNVQSMKVVSENLGNSFSMLMIMFFAAQYYGEIFKGIGLVFLLFALSAIKYLSVSNKLNPILSSEKNETTPINKKELNLTVAAVFIVGIIYAQQRIAYPLFLNETFASFTLTALFFWLDPIIVSLFQVKVTKRASSLNLHQQLAIGALLLGTGLFALILVQNISGVVLACLIFILGEMLFMPTSFVHCYESVGSSRKGMASGLWRSAYATGLIAGPILSGFLMEHYNYNACWLLAGGLGVFLFILFFSRAVTLRHN